MRWRYDFLVKGEILVFHRCLRAVVSNYWESVDSCKNSNFFFFHQKIPLGKLFSKTIFKSSSESPVWRKIEKFEIWVKPTKRLVKIMQIKAFSKRSYKTTETCFCLKFTGFVTHFLKLLSTYILSWSMLSFQFFLPSNRRQCFVLCWHLEFYSILEGCNIGGI